jgi:hypothetical protein
MVEKNHGENLNQNFSLLYSQSKNFEKNRRQDNNIEQVIPSWQEVLSKWNNTNNYS